MKYVFFSFLHCLHISNSFSQIQKMITDGLLKFRQNVYAFYKYIFFHSSVNLLLTIQNLSKMHYPKHNLTYKLRQQITYIYRLLRLLRLSEFSILSTDRIISWSINVLSDSPGYSYFWQSPVTLYKIPIKKFVM